MGDERRTRVRGDLPGVTSRLLVALVALLLTLGASASIARADGDPASDVLATHALFLPADAHVTRQQQDELIGLLTSADRAGFPIHVAVIDSDYDLGSVTALWHRPRTYARFLGIELSLVHRGPLLVVMPDGFGFDWPGHATGTAYARLSRIPLGSRAGLLSTTRAAVRTLATASGHPLPGASARAPGAPSRGHGVDALPIILAVAAVLLAALALVASRLALRGRRRGGARVPAAREPARPRRRAFPGPRWAIPGFTVLCCVATGVPILVVNLLHHTATAAGTRASAVATPYTWRAGARRAPGFRLTGENGRPVSLAAFRGRPVIVTFIDPLCRNLCPLAAHVLNQVDRDMPPSQRPVILAVSVDVYADSHRDLSEDFRRWSLVPQWHWAVGSARRLAAVWARYHVGVSVKTKTIAGTTVHFITHSEVAFVIDRSGYVRELYGWPYYPENVEAAVRRLERT